MVDAGHGGSKMARRGAAGTLEKNVTLAVARRLKAALEARLGVRVMLTRDDDATVGLDERAAVANNNKADLFVSLHANASLRASATRRRGLLPQPRRGRRRGRSGWRSATASPLPVFGGGTRDIELIPWDMAQARYLEQSAALAQAVEGALRGSACR